MLGINSSNNTQLIGFDKDRKKLKLAAESVNANSKIKFWKVTLAMMILILQALNALPLLTRCII